MKAAQYGRGENLHYYYNHSGTYNTSQVIIFFICNYFEPFIKFANFLAASFCNFLAICKQISFVKESSE